VNFNFQKARDISNINKSEKNGNALNSQKRNKLSFVEIKKASKKGLTDMVTKAKTLEETKGKFKLVGKIVGIDNENAFRSGVTRNGDEYQAINFFVETSPNNRVPVELFGLKQDTLLFMNFKEKDKKKNRKDVAWANRYDNHGDFMLVGSTTVKLDENEKKSDRITQYEAVEAIFENFEEGDWVEVNGQVAFEEWESEDGEKHQRYKCRINSFKKIKERNFEDEKFTETNEFSQTCVINECIVDSESKRLLIQAKIVNYKGEPVDTTFAVDIERYKKLATNLKKRLSFGDEIRFVGEIRNMVEWIQEKEIEDEEEEDWGGDNVSLEDEYQRNVVKELYVIGVGKKSHVKEKYTEDDLFNEDVENFGSDVADDLDDLDDDDLDLDINDDDLPFGDE
jgi:single-stranded DNA-binding protein